ncbi:MAG: replication initiator protein A, partial [Solirubrobacterales bacterium]|nr:replication initiator protein A [Solirubrobacterales bacterium]
MHPVWEPVVRGEPLSEPFVACCLLGAGWVGAKRRLSMLDLRVWAALCALLRAQYLRTTGEHDPDLDYVQNRTVETTGYQLAERVFAADSGEHYRLLRASLRRLGGTTITVQTIEADDEPEALPEGVASEITSWTGVRSSWPRT